jgi:hypothetical protein
MDKQFLVKNISNDSVTLSMDIDGKIIVINLNHKELEDLLFELNLASMEINLQGMS